MDGCFRCATSPASRHEHWLCQVWSSTFCLIAYYLIYLLNALRLPRDLFPTLQKCYDCHGELMLRKVPAPRVLRRCSELAPIVLRPGVPITSQNTETCGGLHLV